MCLLVSQLPSKKWPSCGYCPSQLPANRPFSLWKANTLFLSFLLHPNSCPSSPNFCLTMFGIFMLTRIPHVYILKFDCLLLICCMSFELFNQPGERKGSGGSLPSPYKIMILLKKASNKTTPRFSINSCCFINIHIHTREGVHIRTYTCMQSQFFNY